MNYAANLKDGVRRTDTPKGLPFVLLIILVTGVLRRYYKKINPDKRKYDFYRTVFYISLISFVVFIMVSRLQNRINDRNAKMIVSKIEKFRKENGIFPEDLDLLCPDYFDNVPKAWIGLFPEDFIYDYANKESHKSKYFHHLNNQTDYFILGYDGYIGVFSHYNSIKKQWYHDD